MYSILSNEPTEEMLAVTLDPKMEQDLEQLATTTGHSKGFYVKVVPAEYPDTRADYLSALAALEHAPFLRRERDDDVSLRIRCWSMEANGKHP